MIEDSVRMDPGGDMDTKMIENALVQVTGGVDAGELIEIPDGRELVEHDLIDGNIDPYIGMEFESEESAMIFYDAYARRVGFVIRVGNCHRSGRDGSVISRRFLCNKEGFRVNNKKTKHLEVRKPRAITREGCKAMIMVRKENSGKWVVSKLETEHSHTLGIPAGKGRRDTIQARPQVLLPNLEPHQQLEMLSQSVKRTPVSDREIEVILDEKDKKIRELTIELHRTNQKLAECREQLEMVLKDIEIHTNHLTKSVQDIVENVKEIETEDHDYAYH